MCTLITPWKQGKLQKGVLRSLLRYKKISRNIALIPLKEELISNISGKLLNYVCMSFMSKLEKTGLYGKYKKEERCPKKSQNKPP